MKRLGLITITLIGLYSFYYDLSIGTLPKQKTEAAEEYSIEPEPAQEPSAIEKNPYKEVTVEPGHTVLSIVERLHDGPIPASIQEIVYDFKQLNHGMEPEEIQIGKAYRFPLYQ